MRVVLAYLSYNLPNMEPENALSGIARSALAVLAVLLLILLLLMTGPIGKRMLGWWWPTEPRIGLTYPRTSRTPARFFSRFSPSSSASSLGVGGPTIV